MARSSLFIYHDHTCITANENVLLTLFSSKKQIEQIKAALKNTKVPD